MNGNDAKALEAEVAGLRQHIKDLQEGIGWLVRTVHGAHHFGNLEDCQKNTCDWARKKLGAMERG